MKVLKSGVLILGLLILGSAPAWSHEDGKMGEHPCAKILKACKAAGFAKGQAKDEKGIFKNCMHPIMEGKAVSGVNIDAATVAGCKEKKAKHHEHQEHSESHS